MNTHDIASETLVTVNELARRFPSSRPGRGVHPNTIRRWARKGLYGISLGTIRIGGTVYTSEQEFGRWRLAVERARSRANEVSPALAAQAGIDPERRYQQAKRVNDWLRATRTERRTFTQKGR